MEIGVILTHIVKMTSIDEVSLEFVILFKFQLKIDGMLPYLSFTRVVLLQVWQSVVLLTLPE